jgi:hypothetical protein
VANLLASLIFEAGYPTRKDARGKASQFLQCPLVAISGLFAWLLKMSALPSKADIF